MINTINNLELRRIDRALHGTTREDTSSSHKAGAQISVCVRLQTTFNKYEKLVSNELFSIQK